MECDGGGVEVEVVLDKGPHVCGLEPKPQKQSEEAKEKVNICPQVCMKWAPLSNMFSGKSMAVFKCMQLHPYIMGPPHPTQK